MEFKGIQKRLTYKQINNANLDKVFPLLCPVKEIRLKPIEINKTEAVINYQYTVFNKEQNSFIKNGLEASFIESMEWWERAINYYLETGEVLKKTSNTF